MPLTKALLNLIYATGEIAVDFYYITHDAKYHRGAFMRGGHEYVEELERLKDKRKLYFKIRQLKSSKYVEINRRGSKLMLKITEKGRRAILIDALRRADKCVNGYTFVVFDIPESKRRIRQQFRLLLKQGGFVKLQQSVWFNQKDVYKLLVGFIKEVEIESWVRVFYGNKLSW